MNRNIFRGAGSLWRWPVGETVLAIVLVALSGPGFAAKGGIPGPPTGGESTNNLSTPGLQTQSVNSIDANWAIPASPVLGEHYSYGCDAIEEYDEFKYPNTSCVDELMEPTTYYTAEQCVAVDMPCEGFAVEELSRIYWQKVDVNEWWADDEGISPDPAEVAYVDWGDALEAVSWNERSVIRVETQPWSSTIPDFDPADATCADAAAGDPSIDCKVGFQMWHVSGQGITEHWGVRASDSDAAVSYNYDSPFQIINSTEARLNLTKMAPGGAECSQPGGNPGDEPPDVGAWDSTNREWGGTCTWYDDAFTVETSVGGKYVYGFNWRMKNVDVESICGPGWLKTGFWRLTFYSPTDVLFSNHRPDDPVPSIIPNVAPPSVPAEVRVLPAGAFNTVLAPAPDPDEEPEEEEDDRLYVPQIDPVNHLTYLDICIVGKTQGGGGGGGGGGGRDR